MFMTGTDTGVGKTVVACAPGAWTRRQCGARVAVMKPVASGASRTPAGLRNDDALALMRGLRDGPLPYGRVNPYCSNRQFRRTSPQKRPKSGRYRP